MKKILFICLLAILTFSLAGSVQAESTVTITSPNGGEQWNKGATKKITWSYSGTVTNSKFDISITPSTSNIAKFIKKQVPCGAIPPATDCSYPWPVSSIVNAPVNADYKITVCTAGSTVAADCDSSNGTFRIIPPELTTQQEVFDLFKTAMGNRYNNLDADYNSGVAGVRDFILNKQNNVYLITVDMVNADKIYAKTTIEQLDWFKSKFNGLKGSFLNDRDKNGIKNAMSNRYKDFCANDRTTSINAMMKIYNATIAPLEVAKRKEIKDANTAYNISVKGLTGTNTLKFVSTEGFKIVRDRRINTAYNTFYAGTDAARATLSTAYGNGQISASGTGIEKVYYDCINDAKVTLWW